MRLQNGFGRLTRQAAAETADVERVIDQREHREPMRRDAAQFVRTEGVPMMLRRWTYAALIAGTVACAALTARAQEDSSVVRNKEDLVSPEAREIERQNAGLEGGIAGDPNTLLYPLNQGTWTLVDFCVSNCEGNRPAGPPGCNRNDDDTSAVALPFTFTLFGDTYTATNVSNNGNLNFGACNSAFTATGFPAGGGLAMVAGFWGDVDTGNENNPGLGAVWQRFVDSDGDTDIDTFVVTWDNVGYFNLQGNLRNTFQIAISDGTNPTMGIGNNVCFSYSDMAWTTGSASGGVGGFGGTPATVGVNRGDGVDFAQVGRFNEDNANYDGPAGNNDGVHYLDNQNFCFNATGQNVCPIPQNFPPADTFTVFAPGGVLNAQVQFSSPEFNQTTSLVVVDVDGALPAGLVLTNTPGNPATLDLDWAVDCDDEGLYRLDIAATDSDPEAPCTTNVTLFINVVVVDTTPPQLQCSFAGGGAVDANCEILLQQSLRVTDDCCVDANDLQRSVQIIQGSATLELVLSSIAQLDSRTAVLSGTYRVSNITQCPVVVQFVGSATDCEGNAAAPCTLTQTVVDATPPTIGCPPDIFVEHGNFLCDTEALDWLNSATATDNCDDAVTITNDAPQCGFPYGSETLVTWTATDDCGNTATCSATITVAPAGRANASEKGSLLIYPKVELRWNAQGQLTQDTFISLFNDASAPTWVQLYFINGDAPLPADGAERAHPGWNWVDNQIQLTRDEPSYWSVASGLPKGVSPFHVLDPGPPPGRPDGLGGRILRGYVIGWAVNNNGQEVRWNHLSGSAMVISYTGNWAYEYTPWAYQSRCVAHGAQPLDCTLFDANGTCCTAQVIPGNLDLDGFQYDLNPDRLSLDFFAAGSAGYGQGTTLNTDLVLLPASADLRQDSGGPVRTKAHFDIWNQNEIRFSGTTRCIACWDSTLLSQYGPPGHFMRATLQTDKGKARIDGQASTICQRSADAALLGIAVKIVRFTPNHAEFAGSTLVGQGTQAGRIQNDVIAPPQEVHGAKDLLDQDASAP
jgi:hypothetical protein